MPLLLPSPNISETSDVNEQLTLTLDALVRMKLTSYQRKDQMHLIDMIDVGLIDQSWTSKLPAALAKRLQELLDNPEG